MTIEIDLADLKLVEKCLYDAVCEFRRRKQFKAAVPYDRIRYKLMFSIIEEDGKKEEELAKNIREK